MSLHQEAAIERAQPEATQAVFAAPPMDAAPLAKVYMKVLNEKEVQEKDVLPSEDENELEPFFASLYINALSQQMGQVVCTSAVLFIPIYGLMLARVRDLVHPFQRAVCMFTIGLDIYAFVTSLHIWSRIRRAKRGGTAEEFAKVLIQRGPGWRYRFIPLALDIPHYMCMNTFIGLFVEVVSFVWYYGRPENVGSPWTSTELKLEYAADIVILAPLCFFSTYVIGHAFAVHQLRVKAAAAGQV